MAGSLDYPEGYTGRRSRDEFCQPCWDLYHRDLGCIDGEFSCEAAAIYAAQDHADALADEASEAAAAAAEQAYEDTLDTLHAMVAAFSGTTDQGDDVARGERRAVRHVLSVINGIGSGLTTDLTTAAHALGQAIATDHYGSR